MEELNPRMVHMEREFRQAGLLSGTNEMEELIVKSLRTMMGAFTGLNLDGDMTSSVLHLFDRLVNGFPLTPLTGDADEWIKPNFGPEDDTGMLQNVRCGRVFKMPDGSCIDAGAKPMYIMPDGMTFTKSDDKAPEVTFPYMPGFPPMVRVDEKGNPLK